MSRHSLLLLLAIGLFLSACNAGKMAIKKGDKKMDRGEYDLAIDYYQKAADKNYRKGYALYKVGEALRKGNKLHASEPYYAGAIEAGYTEDSARMHYGFALKANQKYEEARDQFDKLSASGTIEGVVARANKELTNLDKLDKLREKETFFRVKNLEEVNTATADYSPLYFNKKLYFVSARKDDKVSKATGTPFTDIFQVDSKGAVVDMSTLESLGDEVNDEGIHEGSLTFSRDGRTMIFAKGNSGKRKGKTDVHLYITRYRNQQWSEPVMLNINDPEAWTSTPTFSRDGRTLYFSSNRKGGYGGTDIYSARMDGRGRFSQISNLGPEINTAGNEMFPYVSDEGKLYFSSDGHPGFGGLDLFEAVRAGGKISIENLGTPINSSYDDFGLYLFDPSKGWFTSNRPGGAGDDDIYTFVNNDPDLKIVNYMLAGLTKTSVSEDSLSILPLVKVRLLDAEENLLEEVSSNRSGQFSFRVYPEEDYVLIGERPDYFTTRLEFSTKGRSVAKEDLTEMVTNVRFDTTLVLDRIVLDRSIVLENIYYDLDKWDIRPDAAQELDKLVNILKDNPQIRIELSSHTDARADDDYNDVLSQRRAESAVEYIINQGIEAERLRAKGYGEQRLIVKNAQTEEEHQRNRRTEFKVIEYNKDMAKQEEGDEQEGDEESFDEDRYFNNDDQ
ncbi:OmpA family protein [Roseivirga sp. BDSF3-8]|uniref:OmpA family protein n=1 Tax=Roseivirga sp. BDSF3-8 TaxID=3241598 RepID=UPI003531FD22